MPGSTKRAALGPVGRNVIANIDRLRQELGMSWRKLSAALEASGRPIPPLGLSRILSGERRVDVDELVGLATVLGVTPDILLTPPGATAPEHAALRAASDLATRITYLLTATGDPDLAARQVGWAVRRVQIEVEELLDKPAA